MDTSNDTPESERLSKKIDLCIYRECGETEAVKTSKVLEVPLQL